MADEPADADRIEELTRRVTWLDRHRRRVAVGIALVIPALALLDSTAGPARWAAVLLSVAAAIIVWWILEAGLAWRAAAWETELNRIARDRGLPRAELLRRK